MSIDPHAIVTHFAGLHRLARESGQDGRLILAAFGEAIAPAIAHFEIGDIEGMTRGAIALSEMPGANLYAPWALMRPDLAPGQKGGEADIAAVLGFVVDGDGDKGRSAPQPPLPAPYVVETSPGNLQHFLPLDTALPAPEAKELARALKRATMADSADDLSHVWRVPGTLNWPAAGKIKRGRSPEPFAVRVAHRWDGSRIGVGSLRQALAAHWQEPERNATAAAPLRCFDTCPQAAEAFLIRLREAGYFDAGPDARNRYVWAAKACSFDLGDDPGRDIWERVVCWNGDGDDEGTPADQKERDLRWRDCSSLKPDVKPVTFGTLITDAAKVYGWPRINLQRKKSAAEMFGVPVTAMMLPPDTDATATVEARRAGPWTSIDDFVAFLPMHQYIYLPTRQMWPAASLNTAVPAVMVAMKKVQPSTWLDVHRPVHCVTWAPGMPMLIRDRLVNEGGWLDHAGAVTFNSYTPPTITPRQGDASPWIAHARQLFGDDADHLIAWLAHRVQRPGEKVNHAIVLGGRQGIGKDTILEPVKAAVGSANFADVTPQQMLGRFNPFAKSVLLRVSETRDRGETDRYGFYEHLKIYTAAPPDVLLVDEKHAKEFYVPNVVGVVLTTNNADSLHLPADDRRHFVAWNSALSKDDFGAAYWDQIYGWFDRGGNEIVPDYLHRLDLTRFNAKAPPPKTAAFWDIANLSRAPEDADMAEVLDNLGRPAGVTLEQIQRAAGPRNPEFRAWLVDRKNRRLIAHRMEAAGYVPIRNDGAASDGLWKIGNKRQAVYARRELPRRDQIAAATELTGVGASR